jgi:hypothetical protein
MKKKQIDLVVGTRYTRKSDGEEFELVARWPVLLKQLSDHQPRSTTTGRLDAEYDEGLATPVTPGPPAHPNQSADSDAS